jgi:peptide/nickel transport system permease protein
MIRYLIRRLLFAAALVFLVASASLVLARLAPGDFAAAQGGIGANQATVARERAREGLDRPIAAQYAAWLDRAAHLDFGTSLLYGRPVGALVPERAVNTALLAVAALALATLIGLPLGIVTGSRPGALSNGIRALSLVLLSMPPLITSLVLVLLAARTGWFPIGGMTSVDAASARSASDLLWHLALPALALALPIAAMFERLQAQAMTDTLAQPFVAAARARGVPERRLVWRDALRVAIRPCASVYGLVIGTLLSGSFIVEIITAWPGLGRLMYDALRARDVFLVAGCAAAGAIFLAIGSMVSDLALALADPRVRE